MNPYSERSYAFRIGVQLIVANQINNFKNMRSLNASIEQDIYDVLTNDLLTILYSLVKKHI